MKVLVVEDSPLVIRVLQRLFNTSELPVTPFYCSTLSEAELILEKKTDFFLALVDLNLPDAPNGEIVEKVLSRNIPTIVLSASYDDKRRESLLQKGIVDYIVKESRFSYEYVMQLIGRLIKNQDIKVLIAEDSGSYRQLIKRHLERHLYQVIEAGNGLEAIECLKKEPEIKLMLTDYEMPEMDGVTLIQNIRREYETSELKIIGLSAADNPALSSKFIKSGANDFLKKPFNYEELHCRVMHNLEEMELMAQIKDAAYKDYLTGLHNRRYLFEQAETLIKPEANNIHLAMMDLDHFKQINDTYGHEAGDRVLIQVSELIRRSFDRFLSARVGGEEFCIVLSGLDYEKALLLMQKFCELISQTEIFFEKQLIPVTVSIGLETYTEGSLSELISLADEKLYEAKGSGRNRVI